jgi:hypothetical protein
MSDERDITFCLSRQTGKNTLLIVQSVQLTWQRSYDDVARPYTVVVDGDVAFIYWYIWANHDVTRGIILVNGVVPRGLVVGCHLASL